MSVRFLLDTNICIYIRQKKAPKVLARFKQLRAGEAGISVITFGELSYGVERSEHPEKSLATLNEVSSLVPVLPLPEEAGASYGVIRAALERQGKMISNNDLWIAAHAMAMDLVLVTNNEKEFRRVGSLKIENWV